MYTLHNQRTAADTSVNLHALFKFPFKEDDKLQEFNILLEDPANFNEVVSHMKNLGGKDAYDFIKRCLSEMVSDTLIRTYAYDGTKDKRIFKGLKLNEAMKIASHQQNGSDQKGYETAVRKWLRRASERAKNIKNS